MRCDGCAHWLVERVTLYEDGSKVSNFKAPDGKGACQALGIDTLPDFGCASYSQAIDGYSHVEVAQKAGAPWQHSYAGSCPDCGGKGNSGDSGCHRCAGTGKVRHYDDGYVGEERTRLHPKERELARPKTCVICGWSDMGSEWKFCPRCGHKVEDPAKTEVIAPDQQNMGIV